MPTPPDYWTDRVTVVTGASAGLGFALAKAAAAAGSRVVLVARDQDRLRVAEQNLAVPEGRTLAATADVTDPEAVDRLRESVLARFGRVDLLANCAGVSQRGRAIDTEVSEFRRLMEINFFASVQTTAAFVPSLLEQRGHAVHIGSLASKTASRYLGAYPASKHALAAYAQQLRLELGPDLHTLLVCPGPIARPDSGERYQSDANVPDAAQGPAGGARLRGIDPEWLAQRILRACEGRQAELVVPLKARLLFTAAQLSPRFGDWLLTRFTAS
ncbi:MAG: SDR family NAD(P)-dependent oxidoreductase [Planctomycetota bacterium]